MDKWHYRTFMEKELRVQLPVHGADSAIELGPATLKCGQLAAIKSCDRAIDYLEDIEITIEEKEVIEIELEKANEALWRVVEQISGGAGTRSPAPVVRS